MQTVLGIDLGTQSVKVVFYDFAARSTVAVASSPLSLDQDAAGKAEQDPDAWLFALTGALDDVPHAIRDSIQAIGISGQQHGLVALDRKGRPLRPAKLWCDTTTQTEADEIMAACGGRERCITLSGNALVTGFTAPKILWLKKHEPEHYAAMTDILLPHDYLNFALTGEKAMEFGDASGTGLLDVRTRSWCRNLIDAIDTDRELAECLPPFVAAGEFIGETTSTAAGQFGLPAGVPVAAGGGDNMMGAIGTGNVRGGKLTMSLGTSGTLYAHADQPIIDPKGNIAAFCGSTGGWLPLLCTMSCTAGTELMRNAFGIAVDEFDARISQIEAGAGGLIVLPFFNGERTPNLPNAKGCLLGLDASNTTPEHLLRATTEGATFALKFGIDELAELGLRAEEIILTGGGANSRTWRQIVADVTGLPVMIVGHSEGAGLGAALQALWTLERQTNPAIDIASVIEPHIGYDESQRAIPDDENLAAYGRVYDRYQRAVDQIAPLYPH